MSKNVCPRMRAHMHTHLCVCVCECVCVCVCVCERARLRTCAQTCSHWLDFLSYDWDGE